MQRSHYKSIKTFMEEVQTPESTATEEPTTDREVEAGDTVDAPAE